MRVLIADDEPLARDRLERMLARIPDVAAIEHAANGREALDRIRTLEPDAVLLDIHMPGLDGIELARRVKAEQDCPIIFTTAHAEHAVEAFDLSAIDYLVKPIRFERLQEAIDRVRHARGARDPGSVNESLSRIFDSAAVAGVKLRVSARRGDTLRVFDPQEIQRFTASGGYTAFRHGGEEFLLDDSLAVLEEKLQGQGFLRVHRSELIRLASVRAIQQDSGATTAELENGEHAPVSRRLVSELKAALGVV